MVPASYVIVDGEYIGWVGDRYFYLGAGGVWLACDFVRLEHFHRWERSHHDWREHAIRNDHFRRDAQGHEHPRYDERHVQPSRNDSHVQPGRNDPHVQPGPSDVRVQSGGSDPRVVQPGLSESRFKPGSGTPTKAAPKKKVTETDAH